MEMAAVERWVAMKEAEMRVPPKKLELETVLLSAKSLETQWAWRKMHMRSLHLHIPDNKASYRHR